MAHKVVNSSNLKIIKSNRKTLVMQILADLTLIVKAPINLSLQEIHKFIEKNSEWIQKRSQNIQKLPKVAKRQYRGGEEFMYLGNNYILRVGSFQTIQLQDTFLLFPQFLLFRIQKELTAWYIEQAKKIITQQVEWYSKQMDIDYKSITFSDTKSRWGSCSHDNHLQFNWRLIMAPLLVINYVIVHELVHTIEKNHSSSFWNKVRFVNPSYKQQRKWLKMYGDGLVL